MEGMCPLGNGGESGILLRMNIVMAACICARAQMFPGAIPVRLPEA